jgi:hypothetical protein
MQKLSSGIELRRVSFARFCSSRRWEEHRLHSLDNCRQIPVIRYHIKDNDDQLIIKLRQD